MTVLEALALIFGLIAVMGGAVMFATAKFFGGGGLFNSYRRDVASEVFFACVAGAGIGLVLWAAI